MTAASSIAATPNEMLNGIDADALRALATACVEDAAQAQTRWQVNTRWMGGTKSRTHVDHFEIGGRRVDRRFAIMTDEPLELGGTNTMPSPPETLMAGLNACMTVGYVAVASLMGVKIDSIEITCEGDIDLRGFFEIDPDVPAGYDALQYTIRVSGDGTPEQFEQIHETVCRASPMRYTVANPVRLDATLIVE